MKFLPRKQFVPSGIGCADHNDPNCLCDVHIPNQTPLPYTTGPLLWADMALEELDDDTVSERNIHEFFQIMMGLQVNEWLTDSLGVEQKRSVWSKFPSDVWVAIQMHTRAGTEWSLVRHELEDLGVDDTELEALSKSYRATMHTQRNRAKVAGERRSFGTGVRDIEHGHGEKPYRLHLEAGELPCDACQAWYDNDRARRRVNHRAAHERRRAANLAAGLTADGKVRMKDAVGRDYVYGKQAACS